MNLTEIQKIIIRRDFIFNTFKDTYRDDVTAKLLLAFAEQHASDRLVEIKSKHNEVYEKRHQRIMEKINAINPHSGGQYLSEDVNSPLEIETDFQQ